MSEIVRKLRDHVDDRRTAKVLDIRNNLFDAIVHSQDIAIPLGRQFPIAAEFTSVGLHVSGRWNGPSTHAASSTVTR